MQLIPLGDRWRRLSRLVLPQGGSERGAVSSIVAVMLAGGVIMGFLALTVDVGNVLWERRQVQNGADAASMAVAKACANSDPLNCVSTSPVAATMNNANASDATTSTDLICGRGVTGLPACTSTGNTSNLGECPDLAAYYASGAGATIPYVEVRSGTRTATGGTILPGFFVKAITGNDGTVHVPACARAAYGPAATPGAHVLNITISECDWKDQTGYTGPGTATYPAGPSGAAPGYGAGNPWPSSEHIIYTKGNPTTCDTSAPGGTAPGGFARLDTVVGCQSDLTVGADGKLWAHGKTGNDLPCSESELTAMRGTVIQVPIFDCLTNAPGVVVTATTDCNSGNGNNTYYRISGFAAYYFAGWSLTSTSKVSIRPPNTLPCTGADRCITGWFIKDPVPGQIVPPGPGGTPNYGLTAIQPIG